MGDLTDHFSRAEFACGDGCGKDDIHPEVVERLQAVRNIFGKPMAITSGVRCAAHNEQEGGVRNSAHVLGLAADVKCLGSANRAKLLPILWSAFKRVGVGSTFIHVDIDDDNRPSPCIFTYYKDNHVA